MDTTTPAENQMHHHSGVYTLSHSKLDEDTGKPIGTHVNSSVQAVNGSHNDDVHLTFSNSDTTKPYRGMGKEELLRFSSQPFWYRLRKICISVILLGWLAMIFAVVGLVLVYPRCRTPESRDWWQSSVMYRIYVRSFQDSNGDGIGDLKGLESRLDYLEELGVGVISLSPVYKTHDADDFDILNHEEIHPDYGTMADFKSLLATAHEKGMYIVMDFIPNHTSDRHPWFEASKMSTNRTDPKRNYYVWSGTVSPPNNWVNMYDESMWEYEGDRNECFLHQFRQQQPDLNLRSALVQQELEDILKFWLDLGVDGFYIRNSAYLFEDFDLRNEGHNPGSSSDDQTKYDYYTHEYTHGLPEVFDMFARWRTVLFHYSNQTEKILLADTNVGITGVMEYYGHFGRDGVQIPLNEFLLGKAGSCDGECVSNYVDLWMNNLPAGKWPNWMMGDENSARFSSRFPANFSRSITMLTLLLPGTPLLYYGDEINLGDTTVVGPTRWGRQQVSRGLMQWKNTTWGGFQNCTSTSCQSPWIGANNHVDTSVAVEESDEGSLLNLIKELIALRNLASFKIGEYKTVLVDKSVFSFVREFDGEKGYLVAINFSPEQQNRDFQGHHSSVLEEADVELTTGQSGRYKAGDEISTNGVTLDGFEGVVLSWKYQAKEL